MIERLADIFCLNNDLRSSFNELSVSLASSCLVPRPHFALLGHCYCPTLVVSWKKFCVMVFGVLLVKHAPFGLCGLQEMVSRWLLCLTGLHVIQRRLSRWATSRPDGRVSGGGGGREREEVICLAQVYLNGAFVIRSDQLSSSSLNHKWPVV